MLAIGRDDPDAARAGTVDISLFVDPNAVGAALGWVGGGIEKQFAISHGAVVLHTVAQPLSFPGVRDVEEPLVRRECQAVRTGEVLDHEL